MIVAAPRDPDREGAAPRSSIAVTVLPFLSLLSAALQPSDSTPLGIEWPSDPQWGNFVDAFNVAQMPALLWSSVTIVLGVVPVAVVISTMAGFAIGHLRIPGGRFLFLLFLLGSDAAVRGHHHAALLPGPWSRDPEHQVGRSSCR